MKLQLSKIVFVLCSFATMGSSAQEKTINIIPKPTTVEVGKGSFILKPSTKIYASSTANETAIFFATIAKKSTGYNFDIINQNKLYMENAIHLVIIKNFPDTTEGAYTLSISPTKIVAKAANNRGLFYAMQSLRQLLPAAFESATPIKNVKWAIPSAQINDAPRFQWRGYMQDVSRTFYNIDVIKKYLDAMALYKLNVFHFHLTDDQGWRIELKKHPELTSKKATVFGETSKQPTERSGFFTQTEIKDIVTYAKDRHIDVVPEIDVPGHCWPIVITNPNLGVNNNLKPDYVISFMDSYSHWGFQYTPNPLDPTKEEVYTFLDDVFGEITSLFPSKYIHFGGDEVRHEFWEKSSTVQAFMRKNNMQKIEQLQSYFVTRVSKIITAKGKNPIGWNDILSDAASLPKSTTIMSWIGNSAVKDAANYGFKVVATPTSPMYFDISQDNVNDGTMVDWNYGGGDGKNGKGNTIKNVYAYDPEDGLTEKEKRYILGVQANMWPAVAQEVKDQNVQIFPRLLALSETAWTNVNVKNYEDFAKRLLVHYAILDTLRLDYFKKGGYIIDTWTPDQITTNFKTMQWDVTSNIYTVGRSQAGFLYTSGSSFLKVKNVKLLENGKIVSMDDHESLADKFRGTPFKKNMFFYILDVDHYNPKSKYTLQADVAGYTNSDSKGNITFNLSPKNPFKKTNYIKQKVSN